MKRFDYEPRYVRSGKKMRTVVDKLCECGAKRSEHQSTFTQGHGSCPETGCPKFTWKGFVFADEAKP